MNHSKMFLVTVLSITTVLLATSTFTPLASAQYPGDQGPTGGQGYQGQGGQGYQGGPGQGGQGFRGQGFHGTRTAVNGTYTNSNFGVQITLPDGWSGFEMKQQSGNARITIAPGGYQATQGAPRPPVVIGISIMPAGSTPPPMTTRNMQGVTCTNSTTTNTVNSLNFNVVTTDCTGTDQDGNPIEMKSKTETTKTSNANIIFSLRANPASGFDSQVTTFDNMISTLQLSTPTQPLTTPQTPPSSTDTTQPPASTTPGKIPNWVKGIFGMYSQGQLSDNDLIQALQFLIKQGIIRV